jgi:type II secretory ATPase GspE/PulE/Tfp pilus assembly ATPase PilB-like protein
VGIFELLVMTDEIKDAIGRQAPRSDLRRLAIEHGLVPLRADAWAKVEAGLTTVEEVLRVVQE